MRCIVRSLRSWVLLLVAMLSMPPTVFSQNSSFLPPRPQNAVLHTSQGTLLDYGIGNKSGGFSVREKTTGKTLEFYVGWPIRIDGRIVTCSIAPKDSFKPDRQFCSDWPYQVRLGHTNVKVTYWNAKYDGKDVNVSDQIDSLK